MAYLPVADRRSQLVRAALEVVSNEGVARATTRRIAEVADMSAASLHYCFATKEELLQAAFEYGTQDGLLYIGRAVTPRCGLAVAVTAIMRAYADWMREAPHIQLAQFELTLWSLRNPASRHLAQRVYRRYIDGTAQLLREAQAGEADAQVDVTDVARLIVAALDGHVLQWQALGDDVFERMVEESVAAITAHLAQRLAVVGA